MQFPWLMLMSEYSKHCQNVSAKHKDSQLSSLIYPDIGSMLHIDLCLDPYINENYASL